MASFFNKITAGVGGGGSAHDQSKEQSLSTILPTHEDKTEFLLLLANCIGFMRRQVLDNFDPETTGVGLNRVLKANAGDKQSITEAAPQSGADSNQQNAPDQEEIEEQRRKAHERRVQELSSAPMVELKSAAINHFDEWRDRVIQRLSEVINQHREEDKNAADTSRQTEPNTGVPSQQMKDDEADVVLRQLYPPQQTTLVKLPQPQRALLLHALILVLLSLNTYSAESRVLMLHVTSSLSLPLKVLTEDETHVAAGLLEAAKQQINADAETKKDAEENASSRKWKVGLGAAAGAVLIGVTGGLAAPLLAAGVGSVMGGVGLASTATAGYLGAMAGSAPLVGALFGAYGGRMTARLVDEYAREVEDFAFIPLHKRNILHGKNSEENARHLRVAIGISGYLTEEAEVVKPWRALGPSIEGFALRWELKSLLRLGTSLTTYIKSYAWGWAKKEIISRTLFATLASAIGAALALPYGMAKAAKVVDNPFSIARSRSEKAGRVLARALVAKVQGERPVTLLGYSLGARVIYTCLDELANQKAFGLVESVIMAGAAVPSDSVAWRKMRSVVSGRLINAYSTNDYLLAFLYRTSSLQYGIAGLQPVYDVPGIENIDVSDLVDGHTQYRFMTSQILEKAGLEDIDLAEVAKQVKEMQEQRRKDAEELARVQSQDKSAEVEADEMEREVERKTKSAKS